MLTTVVFKPNGCQDKVRFIKAWRGVVKCSLKDAKDIGDAIWHGDTVTGIFDIIDDRELATARQAGVDIILESKDSEYFTRKLMPLITEAIEVGNKSAISILSEAVSKLNA